MMLVNIEKSTMLVNSASEYWLVKNGSYDSYSLIRLGKKGTQDHRREYATGIIY